MTMLHHAISAGLATLAIATLAGAANAEVTAEEQAALRANCRSDFIAHCSGVSPGGRDALVCLQKNVASLSSACQKIVEETLPKPAVAAPAAPTTPPPAAAPAATAAPAKSETPAATAARAPAASPAKAAPAGPTPQQIEAIKSNCRRDYRRHCRGIPPGGPEALACLQRNSAELRPACQASVAAIGQPAPASTAAPPPLQQAPLLDVAIMVRSCRRDLVRICSEVQPGGGRELACLVAHRDELRLRCRLALRRIGAP
jgi:Cysteine rich repeat